MRNDRPDILGAREGRVRGTFDKIRKGEVMAKFNLPFKYPWVEEPKTVFSEPEGGAENKPLPHARIDEQSER
jgi:hypothetical protein